MRPAGAAITVKVAVISTLWLRGDVLGAAKERLLRQVRQPMWPGCQFGGAGARNSGFAGP